MIEKAGGIPASKAALTTAFISLYLPCQRDLGTPNLARRLEPLSLTRMLGLASLMVTPVDLLDDLGELRGREPGSVDLDVKGSAVADAVVVTTAIRFVLNVEHAVVHGHGHAVGHGFSSSR